jgi:hypothetical protein
MRTTPAKTGPSQTAPKPPAWEVETTDFTDAHGLRNGEAADGQGYSSEDRMIGQLEDLRTSAAEAVAVSAPVIWHGWSRAPPILSKVLLSADC